MSHPSDEVTLELLREWGLPDPGESKKERGRVMVVGGSRRSPGAVLLAGEAALRVGAGRLGLVVPASIEARLGAVMPEAGVLSLPTHATDPIAGPLRDELRSADAVLVGPGFDDADETRATLLAVAEAGVAVLVLDAFALGILPGVERGLLPAALVLNPNEEEAGILLGRDLGDDRIADLREIARRYDAVVNCYGDIATPEGTVWRVAAGGPGLGTSGSGDVLAGAITGFAARGVDPARAAVWGSWAHATAGDRLTARTGIGFLARELPAELSLAVADALGPPA
ncbi:MAG TPA: ADP/ATP-dependent (S)-NAD(P)H-hydrate dehydratase [Microbacterium sp.]|uniref:ADP-dependent NAD(P)H-hydrate dehydratase n=1 Tax=Microbacterium sp. TaxID=51671 RepID=UPI002BEF92D6|nr:ADP/ATP-dependent (S)-NAD(P)H-hydrate dehydratase [Microbacterium sp.]HWI30508.1 ADP/ATP-dependent (S)-NAD(P)H-hydrate dehydratase [Microbacterium sp.]